MSAFGFISLFVVVLCIAIIILHYRIMKKRAPVDVHFSELEELLRERVEILYKINPTGLYELYNQSATLDLEGLLNTLASFEVEHDSLTDNTEAITKIKEALAQAISDYNSFITANPHTSLMAKILGLEIIKKELT